MATTLDAVLAAYATSLTNNNGSGNSFVVRHYSQALEGAVNVKDFVKSVIGGAYPNNFCKGLQKLTRVYPIDGVSEDGTPYLSAMMYFVDAAGVERGFRVACSREIDAETLLSPEKFFALNVTSKREKAGDESSPLAFKLVPGFSDKYAGIADGWAALSN